jgi:hypothetical protein
VAEFDRRAARVAGERLRQLGRMMEWHDTIRRLLETSACISPPISHLEFGLNVTLDTNLRCGRR